MCQPSICRWRWKKGPKQRWSGYFSLCPFPSWKGVFSQNGPQRSRARRRCAAKRTLHGEDRSEILDKRERGGPKWTAKIDQSLTASDNSIKSSTSGSPAGFHECPQQGVNLRLIATAPGAIPVKQINALLRAFME